jgi:AI-2 transport protein TqsA
LKLSASSRTLVTMNLNLTTATRYGLNVLAALGLSVALYLGRSIFIPLTIAGLLAAILWPAASGLHRRIQMPWFVACSIVIAVLVLVVLLMVAVVALSVPQILNDLPKPNDEGSMTAFYQRLRSQFDRALPFGAEQVLPKDPNQSGVYQELKKFFQGEQITNLLLSLSGQGLGLLTEAVLVLFILLFLLVEGQMLSDKVRNIFGPAADVQRQVSAAFREMAESVRNYLVWRTIVNIGLGVLLGAVYRVCGLKQPVLWALLTVILCYIPYLGTIAAGVMPTLDALLNVDPLVAFGLLAFYVIVVTVEGYIIVPWVMGRGMDLNATTVLISCLFWYLVWGTAGLFLAMPLMAAIKAICLQVPGWEAFGHLMGSEPAADEDVVKLATAGPPGGGGVNGEAKPTHPTAEATTPTA